MRRIAVDSAVIALISCGALQFHGDLQERFGRFYYDEIGPYWPPVRRLVYRGDRDMSFRLEEREAPKMEIHQA